MHQAPQHPSTTSPARSFCFVGGCVFAGLIGCVTPAIVAVPTDLVVRPGETVRIESTTAVDLRSIDGEPVEAHAVLTEPGGRSIGIRFRRRLKNQPLGMEKVALFGTCEIPIELHPGATYEIHAQLSSTTTESTDTIRTHSSLVIFVRDRDTLEELPISLSHCEVLTDCRGINREIIQRPPGVCHRFRNGIP